jgi:tetratricopeptide (TPR) repeat protein
MARSLEVQPKNIQFIQNYVTVLCQLGQFETASTVCRRGLELDAGNVYLLYVAAGALLKQGKFTDALAAFDRLLALEARHVPAITERGSVLLELGQHDAARMRILGAVEGSVLWLSRDSEAAVENLRNEAAAAGVDPARWIFADRVPSPSEHLARHRLADLFLD